MVIKRTIRVLRERPHDERHAFAVLSAIIVAVVVAAAWMAFFFNSIREPLFEESLRNTDTAHENVRVHSVSAAASIDDIIQATITSDGSVSAPSDTPLEAYADDGLDMPSYAPGHTRDSDVASELQAALQQ